MKKRTKKALVVAAATAYILWHTKNQDIGKTFKTKQRLIPSRMPTPKDEFGWFDNIAT